MTNPPQTGDDMRVSYPACPVAELAAGYRYTTHRTAHAEGTTRDCWPGCPNGGSSCGGAWSCLFSGWRSWTLLFHPTATASTSAPASHQSLSTASGILVLGSWHAPPSSGLCPVEGSVRPMLRSQASKSRYG